MLGGKRGLDPTDKAARLANYVTNLPHELLRLSDACGSRPLYEVFGYQPGWEVPAQADSDAVLRILRDGA